MAAFKLPRLKANLAIVDGQGKPLGYFLRLFNIELAERIEQQEADQTAVLAAIQAIQVQQADQLALINQALELAGLALETADGGSTTKSGSTTASFNLISTSFTPGPVVSLTSVLAGELSTPGTGPQSVVGTTAMTGGTVTQAEYRLVEVVSGVDTVIFTGTFSVTDITVDSPSQIFQVVLNSSPGTYTRSTTGSVDYRIDTRRVSGANVTGMRFYLFARRAP